MSQFSAVGPTLGYLYQIRYALYLALNEERDEFHLSIEQLDDVAFEKDGTPQELIQTKHHINHRASLTDSSEDLWKTLRVWCEHIKNRSVDLQGLKLILVTTSIASKDSIPSSLRDNSLRNPVDAVEKLEKIAKTSKNVSLKKAFSAFLSLTPRTRKMLINSIFIVDGSLHIEEVPKTIQRKLIGIRPSFREAAYTQIEGWWFNRSINHLNEQLDEYSTISNLEIHNKIADFGLRYSEDNLPIHYGVEAGNEPKIPEDADDRMFVEQLKAIGVSAGRIDIAIRNYYRAFEQRAQWARLELLQFDEVERYEKKLVEEWELIQIELTDEFGEDVTNVEMQRCGRMLLNRITSKNIPIRKYVGEEFVMRGSYHMLADDLKGATPKVIWHPMFLERIKSAFGIIGG